MEEILEDLKSMNSEQLDIAHKMQDKGVMEDIKEQLNKQQIQINAQNEIISKMYRNMKSTTDIITKLVDNIEVLSNTKLK